MVEETKSKITNSTDHKLILSDEIVSVIEPEVEPIKIEQAVNSTINQQKLLDMYQKEISNLTEKIKILENEVVDTNERLQKFDNLSNKWRSERSLIKELIRIDENLIYENEIKLNSIHARPFSYQADRNGIVRIIMEFLTKNPDEILTNGRIVRHEIKRQNRMEHLLNIESELGDVTLLMILNENILKSIESTICDFRSVRVDMGKNSRELKTSVKNNQLIQDKNTFIKNFTTNIQKINDLGTEFINSVENTQNYIRRVYTEFDQFQKGLLLPESKTIDLNQATNSFDVMFKNISNISKQINNNNNNNN